MNAIPYDGPEEEWDRYEDEQDAVLPGRPRRKVLTWWTAGLFALVLGAVGFYLGVRVEKNQLANGSSTAGFAAAAGAGSRAGAGAGGAARSGAASRAGAGTRAATFAGGGGAGFRGLFGGAGGAGAGAFGTVSDISGNSLYVTETSGSTIKVTLSSATKVTKNVTVGKRAVRPGDLVVVAGAKGGDGTVSATTVSDTGTSPAGAAGSSPGSSSTGTSGSSAVNSLFGGS